MMAVLMECKEGYDNVCLRSSRKSYQIYASILERPARSLCSCHQPFRNNKNTSTLLIYGPRSPVIAQMQISVKRRFTQLCNSALEKEIMAFLSEITKLINVRQRSQSYLFPIM